MSVAATMPPLTTYRIVLDAEPDGSTGNVSVPALSGCVPYGRTVAEALERAREAITGRGELLPPPDAQGPTFRR